MRAPRLLFGITLSACASAPSMPDVRHESEPPEQLDVRVVHLAAGAHFVQEFRGCGTHAVILMPAREEDPHRPPIVLEGSGPVEMDGPAALVVATIPRAVPCGHGRRLEVPASSERLVWANETMRAYPEALTRALYIGRLYGNASVPEHVHAESWELLCGIKASGTYTLDGVAHRLADGECAKIPPGTKHSWTADPGTSLEAVQIYSPPGPEERFRKLSTESGASSK